MKPEYRLPHISKTFQICQNTSANIAVSERYVHIIIRNLFTQNCHENEKINKNTVFPSRQMFFFQSYASAYQQDHQQCKSEQAEQTEY